MSTRFFTNQGAQTLLAKFKGVFESNPDIEWFDALVGYLRASGYFAIRPYLSNVDHVRILVGINVDGLTARFHNQGLLFKGDGEAALKQFLAEIRGDIESSAYEPEVERGILQFIEDVASRKVVIRAHPSKRLHAKIYVFRPHGYNEHRPGAVITGSSNLTAAGLGAHETDRNYEFNVLLHDFDDVQFASAEFERLWNESTEVLPVDLGKLKNTTYLGVDPTPLQLYYKLLLEYFGPAIDYDPSAAADLPEDFKRLSYQIEAVASGFRLLEKHGGFFLADVVGLGKTIVACLIAKRFFYQNGFPSHVSHTLIVVPPALRENWKAAVDKFRLSNVEFITNGSLHKIDHPEKYDLVIVDEAHKFRNDTADAFDELQRVCKTPSMRRLPDGSRARKKVILVSATPLNNRPSDIANQLSLFQDMRDSTLSVANLQHFFARREREYREAKRAATPDEARAAVKHIYESIRSKVLEEVTIRRTRRDLLENEDYRKDLAENNVVFPRVDPPRKIFYPLSAPLEELYDRTMDLISRVDGGGLSYNRYRAIAYLKPEYKERYESADRIALQLATIMRTLLVKRLDSSFTAFRISLGRFRDATRTMVESLGRGVLYIAPNLNVTQYLLEDREDELLEKIEERQPHDPTILVCKPDYFTEGFVDGLTRDLERLNELCDAWELFKDEDPKRDEFLRHLKTEFFDREKNHEGRKLVIFSEARDTTEYLARELKKAGYDRFLTVDSATRKDRMPTVRANFDANAKHKAHDFDILISTEVLAEGINLHRANIIVNYDTPWNSTRLMQRIGRVNRIGTLAPCVYVYNFYPTAQVDNDIELHKKALMKLQAFHTALGEDSQIYSTSEEVQTFGLFDRPPEDSERDERLALLMELRKFRQENPDEFRKVKHLPLRARVARTDPDRAGQTATYIRNPHRDGFYKIAADGAVEEITIVEAAREFRALDPDEKGAPIPDSHFAQVNAALENFRTAAVRDALEDRVIKEKLGPNQQRAIQFLGAVMHSPLIGDAERRLIRAAMKAIDQGALTNLHREINQLQKSIKTTRVATSVLLDRLVQILKNFPLETEAPEDRPPTQSFDTEIVMPTLILSETFVAPPPA